MADEQPSSAENGVTRPNVHHGESARVHSPAREVRGESPPALNGAGDAKLRSDSVGSYTGRKRSRSNDPITHSVASSMDPSGGYESVGGGVVHASPAVATSSRQESSSRGEERRRASILGHAPLTAVPTHGEVREGGGVVAPPVVYNDLMLSQSTSECEIAEFGRILDDMLIRVSNRDLVKQTADYMRTFRQHSLRFQIKMKQRALSDATRQAQSKLMLVYVFHEFFKTYQGDELMKVQREWFGTVDEVLHACVRDLKNNEDARKRLIKTLARWEELGIFSQKVKQWKSLGTGEVKPRRPPMRLPRTEAERLAEVPDQLQQFPPPPNQPQLQINRTNYPYVFNRSNFSTAFELKQHWRYTAVSFIEVLAQCLGLSRDIALTASMFFHRVFDRGIYAQERFKFAAACIFLSAKASSKRMKLIRMVKTMHEILEMPLLAGDEELLELERMQLLHYEIEVLKGIEFELATELPFLYLRQTLEQMPEKFRRDVQEEAHSVLEELFWLPLCLSTRPAFLAEAAAYIACRNKDRIFSFKWCREASDGALLTEKAAKDILKEYRQLNTWKKEQRRHFDELSATATPSAPTGMLDLNETFKVQRGGLRIDTSIIQIQSEYTEKGVNESKEHLTTYVGGAVRSSGTAQRRNGEERSVKQESRTDRSDRERSDYKRADRDRNYDRDRDRDRDRGRDRDSDRDRGRDRYRDSDRGYDRSRSDRDKDERSDKDKRSSRRSHDHESDRDRRRDRDRDFDSRGKSDVKDRNKGREYSKDEGNSRRDRESDRDRRGNGDRGKGSDDRSSRRSRDRDSKSSRRGSESTETKKTDSDRGIDRGSSRDDRDSGDRSNRRDRDHDYDRDRDRKSRHSRSRSPSNSKTRKRRSPSRSRSRSVSKDRNRASSRSRKSSSRDRDRGYDRDRYRNRRDSDVEGKSSIGEDDKRIKKETR